MYHIKHRCEPSPSDPQTHKYQPKHEATKRVESDVHQMVSQGISTPGFPLKPKGQCRKREVGAKPNRLRAGSSVHNRIVPLDELEVVHDKVAGQKGIVDEQSKKEQNQRK